MTVNADGKTSSALSTKAGLLGILRAENGRPVSGGKIARELGLSRVAVWKGVQSLAKAGYPVDATRARPAEAGYSLDPGGSTDFLFPWEFGEDEPLFRHFEDTDSTMNRTRECAARGNASGTVVIAERQSAGKGRCGRGWISGQGGLYFTVLERPVPGSPMATADYRLPLMLYQIAVARALGSLCGKPARPRWPNDVYVGGRKIAGLVAELAGEGDHVSWLATGIGVNVNNAAPLEGSTSCAELARRRLSRRELLVAIMDEARKLKKLTDRGCTRAGGNALLAGEWNSMADRIGAKAALVALDSAAVPPDRKTRLGKSRVLASGRFAGVDPAGSCIVKTEGGEGDAVFGAGYASLVFR